MKYGARNNILAKVKSVKDGDVMSIVKFDVMDPAEVRRQIALLRERATRPVPVPRDS